MVRSAAALAAARLGPWARRARGATCARGPSFDTPFFASRRKAAQDDASILVFDRRQPRCCSVATPTRHGEERGRLCGRASRTMGQESAWRHLRPRPILRRAVLREAERHDAAVLAALLSPPRLVMVRSAAALAAARVSSVLRVLEPWARRARGAVRARGPSVDTSFFASRRTTAQDDAAVLVCYRRQPCWPFWRRHSLG